MYRRLLDGTAPPWLRPVALSEELRDSMRLFALDPGAGRRDWPEPTTALIHVEKTLIIQIPCFNEAETLGVTLAALPRAVEGFARVEWMVIDDGCSDDTVAVALAHGVDHIVRLEHNQGLARAFAAGLEAAVRAGADVIVNTDADNQYCAEDIPKLTRPILAGEADLVIGARPIMATPHFSQTKKALQMLGSLVVRMASTTTVVDAPSGFRAFSRKAAQSLHVHGEYSYTLETIIAAGTQHMAVDVGADPHQPGSAPVTAGQEPAGLRRPLGGHDRAHLCDLSAAALLRQHRRGGAVRRALPGGPLPLPCPTAATATSIPWS